MMMIYGMFVFQLSTLPHQQIQQSRNWRHVKNERINRSASWQYIGAVTIPSRFRVCSTRKLRAVKSP
ncbi:tail fiber protein [Escherichia coli]|uniref:Tail fiber protein n=1 Tax=Escherichia coli TaxID=562 RepID=A0A377DL25_ECOLX|nr:tail fiber protein [Escherichia coli]